jgi:hypothetical protein
MLNGRNAAFVLVPLKRIGVVALTSAPVMAVPVRENVSTAVMCPHVSTAMRGILVAPP